MQSISNCEHRPRLCVGEGVSPCPYLIMLNYNYLIKIQSIAQPKKKNEVLQYCF